MIIRPIVVVREARVSDQKYSYILSAIRAFLRQMNVVEKVGVMESSAEVLIGAQLEVLLAGSRVPNRPTNTINVDRFDDLLTECAERQRAGLKAKVQPHRVFVVERDLRWFIRRKWNSMSGFCSTDNVIVSVDDYVDSYRTSHEERVKMVIIHELGHRFGLNSFGGEVSDKDGFGAHCANWCIMRSDTLKPLGLTGPLLDRRLNLRFCARCYFKIYSRINSGKV